MRYALFLLAAMVLATGAFCAPCAAKDRPKIKLLFLVGGGYHDFDKQPKMLKSLLEAMGDFEVTLTDDKDQLKPENIKAYDEVLFDTQGSELTSEQEKGLTSFVRAGGGWSGIHSASDSFKDSKAYINMIGGVFKTHGNEMFEVKIEDKDHPITRGLRDFKISDETYVHNYDKDAPIHVLARRVSDKEPSVWVRNYGKGRVFFTGLGHGASAWNNRSFQTIVVRGLYWAAERTPKPLPTLLFVVE